MATEPVGAGGRGLRVRIAAALRSPSGHFALAVLLAALVGTWIHRLTLLRVVAREIERGAAVEGSPWGAAWRWAGLDVAVALAAALAAAALVALFGRLARGGRPRHLALHGPVLIIAPLLLAVGALRRGHLEMVAAMHVGLGADELLDVLRSGEAATASTSASPLQLLAAGAPALLFVAMAYGPRRAGTTRLTLATALATAALVASTVHGSVAAMPAEASLPPELWTSYTVAHAAYRAAVDGDDDLDGEAGLGGDADDGAHAGRVDVRELGEFGERGELGSHAGADDERGAEAGDAPHGSATARVVAGAAGGAVALAVGGAHAVGASANANADANADAGVDLSDTGALPLAAEVSAAIVGGPMLARIGARLADPAVVEPASVANTRPRAAGKRWNVLWIIMESTGSRYVEGESYPGRRPMPFLDQLAAQGWYLSAHRSPSNSSATSISAQMTGLYPMPSTKMMSVAKDNALVALPAFLPGYDRFLYTPGKLDYFFPRGLLEHAGLRELVGFHELAELPIRAEDRLSRDEIATVDAFIARLERAEAPFFAVYYSFVPHWEYTDYGSAWRRYRGPRMIDHYHNSLGLLDAQIRRIFEALERKGHRDDTIVVIAGDHGEAFGQHERNWAHSRGSYEENLQTPALLWQPALFAPRRLNVPTSHIDLLPTVLDAMALRYDARLLQGESLFLAHGRRRVTFHWGNEGTVTALRHVDQVKLQISVKDRSCRVFRLDRDPRERKPVGCKGHEALRDVARAFVRTQRALLPAMSAAAAAGEPFEGIAHPLPAPPAGGASAVRASPAALAVDARRP